MHTRILYAIYVVLLLCNLYQCFSHLTLNTKQSFSFLSHSNVDILNEHSNHYDIGKLFHKINNNKTISSR